MKLGCLATRSVISVSPGDSIDKAIGLMDEHDIHHLPVVEHARVLGMISDRDLLVSVGWKHSSERRRTHTGGDPVGPVCVEQVMSRPVYTISMKQSVQEAALTMIEKKIGAVVLTGSEGILGILTRTDLLKHAGDFATNEVAQAVLDEAVEMHMRANVLVVRPKDPISEATSLMHREGVRHLPVCADEFLVGIVTDRDVRRSCGLEMVEDQLSQIDGRNYAPQSTVLSIMSKQVEVISPDTTLLEAADRMVRRRIGALPVVFDEKLVGIITDSDLVRILARLG